MILIIGGAYSGKRDYAATQLGFDLKEMSDRLDNAPVLYNLQALLRHSSNLEALLPEICKKKVVICDEIGCGVVPILDDDRAWRETVGRACCALALKSEKVVRLQCGIATIIKGDDDK